MGAFQYGCYECYIALCLERFLHGWPAQIYRNIRICQIVNRNGMAVVLHDNSEWIPDQYIDGEGSHRLDFDPHWVVQPERRAETIHVVDRCASLGSKM